MRPLAVLCLLLFAGAAAAEATPITMNCKNPRREYLVTFDESKRTLTAAAEEGLTPYQVLTVQKTPNRLWVSGLTPTDGLPSKRIFGLIRKWSILRAISSSKRTSAATAPTTSHYGALPPEAVLRIKASSSSRSSAPNRTTYFFTETSFATMIRLRRPNRRQSQSSNRGQLGLGDRRAARGARSRPRGMQ